MLWVPTISADVLRLALPALNSIGLPSNVEPSLKVMVPPGFVPVTVAVKVTDSPLVIVVAETVSAVVVAIGLAGFTVSVTGVEMLAALLLSPL